MNVLNKLHIFIASMLLFLLLCSCANEEVINVQPQLETYGSECYSRPYSDHRDDQALCITSALAKHHAQVKVINGKAK